MKVLVAVKRVTDPNVAVKVKLDNSDIDITNVKMALNPFCAIAVEEAVRLKERGVADDIVVVSIGTRVCEEQIRTALAMGCHRGVRVDVREQLTSINIAKVLRGICAHEQPDLIFMGKQATDTDNGLTGPMLAGLMDIAQGIAVSGVEVQEDLVRIIRENNHGTEKLSLSLPAVITADYHLNEPRFVTLAKIMAAKHKPIDVIAVDELLKEPSHNLITLSVEEPKGRDPVVMLPTTEELVTRLRTHVGAMQ